MAVQVTDKEKLFLLRIRHILILRIIVFRNVVAINCGLIKKQYSYP